MVAFKSRAQCAGFYSMSEWTTLREPIKFTEDAEYLLKIK